MKDTQFSGASIGVLGLGKSGRAAADVLAALGAHVTCYDANPDALQQAREELGDRVDYCAATGEQLQGEAAAAKGHKLFIVSPGIAPHNPLYRLPEASAPMWSEVELAWQIQEAIGNRNCKWLCITGTNGKTTTTGMLAQMLITGGVVATAVGNYGTPIVQVAAEGAVDALAVELSSAQLHSTYSLKPWASVWLNFAPDHIDWHGSADEYAWDKSKVYCGVQRAALYPATEELPTKVLSKRFVQEQGFPVEKCIGLTPGIPTPGFLGVIEDVIVDRAFGENNETQALELATFADLEHLSGAKTPTSALLADTLAAAGLARSYGLQPVWVRRGIREFELANHRRAVVGTFGGVTYIDDSKATNTHAAAASLRDIADKRAVWIVGGDAKGQDFHSLVQAVAPKVKAAVLIGLDSEPFESAFAENGAGIPVKRVAPGDNLMERTLNEARALAVSGDTVLLAPACASWDQFNNYHERGDQFAQVARRLGENQDGGEEQGS
ncbi:UDP-N-acetylmuramoyl-L-alanine--D-glutamate ligase [Mobiluncus curtisii]|uniref:UDP-N-acetylmuramoyl-L-alanine--D-glutamate ligase n=1 Tax=Mobiluncus curtisii TaxID=2051 RepID=UPI00321197A7